MREIFELPFLVNSLIVGSLIGLLASYYGVFIVQRKLGFLGTGISHAAFGGVALGLLLGIEPLYIALPFTLIVAFSISLLEHKTKLSADTAIGIMFSFAMALGVIFLSLKDDYTSDAFSYLFGSLLAVSPFDVYWAIGLTAFAIITLPLWNIWAYSTFDKELAQADGINTNFYEFLFSGIIAVIIVVAAKIIGLTLIAAFIVIPAASARLLSKTLFQMTLISVIIGSISSVAGLLLSFYYNFPSGASIVVLQTVIFAIAFLIKSLRKN